MTMRAVPYNGLASLASSIMLMSLVSQSRLVCIILCHKAKGILVISTYPLKIKSNMLHHIAAIRYTEDGYEKRQ